ncbi:MAG: homoserine kinase [Chloroflexi bacterium]|nr:MAG: homoserine kinase [Chloroflexota bacterium]
MANSSAEAYAPATVANLGVGFDILGLAVAEPGDIVRVERCHKAGATIVSIVGDNDRLPDDPAKNTACIAANSVLRMIGVSGGVEITLNKGLPLASGLGSSAASAVAAAVAVNALYDEPLSREELLPACLDGEEAVSGRHADNVGPSLFGGITLITGETAGQIYRLPVPDDLHLALITPAVEVPTAEARAVLPKQVSLHDMIAQTGAVAKLVDALYRGDVAAVAQTMEQDVVVEPARAHLMPMLTEARLIAKHNGAHGLVISGAGPTLCAVCGSGDAAQQVADAVVAMYRDAGITSVGRATQVASDGARILSVN